MAGLPIDAEKLEKNSYDTDAPDSNELKINRWLEFGWRRSLELLQPGRLAYDEWWEGMRDAAVSYWDCKNNSLAMSLVTPIFWEQSNRVFEYKANIGISPKGGKKHSELILKNILEPEYKKDYKELINAVLEKEW